MANEFPLSLIIRAVDRATAPLRQINQRIKAYTAPVRKLNNSFKALSDEAGVPRVVKAIGGMGSAIGGVGKELVGLALKMGALAGGAGFALYRITRGAVDAGDKLGEMAQRVGLSVDAFAQLQFAAAQSDVEAEQFNAAMDQFNKRLGEAKANGGPLLAFLEKVSPALALQVKGAKDTEQALGFMIRAFEKVKDPGKRAALSAAAFGKSGLQMGQFLGQGGAAIDAYRKRYVELAGSQEGLAKGAGELDNVLRESETAFLGVRNAIAQQLFPAVTTLAETLVAFLTEHREGLAAWARETGAAITTWVQGGGITRLVADLRSIASTVVSVVEALGGLKGLAMIVGAVLGAKLVVAVASVVGAMKALSLAMLGTPFGWFLLGLTGIVASLTWIVTHWDKIKAFFGAVAEGATNAVRSAVEGSAIDAMAVAGGAPLLGADNPAAAPSKSEAKVTIDFANMPKGARASIEPGSTADIDLSLGYSMVTP